MISVPAMRPSASSQRAPDAAGAGARETWGCLVLRLFISPVRPARAKPFAEAG
jgi:hypothetical protein